MANGGLIQGYGRVVMLLQGAGSWGRIGASSDGHVVVDGGRKRVVEWPGQQLALQGTKQGEGHG